MLLPRRPAVPSSGRRLPAMCRHGRVACCVQRWVTAAPCIDGAGRATWASRRSMSMGSIQGQDAAGSALAMPGPHSHAADVTYRHMAQLLASFTHTRQVSVTFMFSGPHSHCMLVRVAFLITHKGSESLSAYALFLECSSGMLLSGSPRSRPRCCSVPLPPLLKPLHLLPLKLWR